MDKLKSADFQVFASIEQELHRQQNTLEMIASENFTSPMVLEAVGSVLTNKYAEGYPGKRYYGGCEAVDITENLARERAKELFEAEYANVQPHSGSQANMGVYLTLLQPGDVVMGLNLSHGGHLTHGSPVNFSGKLYQFISYGVNKETGRVNLMKYSLLPENIIRSSLFAGAVRIRGLLSLINFGRLPMKLVLFSWLILPILLV